MDIDNLFTILMLIWGFRYVAGILWGLYNLVLLKVNPKHFDLVDGVIVGLPFWFGWYLGCFIRWAMNKRGRLVG